MTQHWLKRKIFSPGNSNLELERRAFPRKLTVTLRRRGRSRTQQNLYGIRYIPTWRGTARHTHGWLLSFMTYNFSEVHRLRLAMLNCPVSFVYHNQRLITVLVVPTARTTENYRSCLSTLCTCTLALEMNDSK